jgi:cold shock CspA family protein
MLGPEGGDQIMAADVLTKTERIGSIRRFEYKVLDTGKSVEYELQRSRGGRLASRRRHDEEAAADCPTCRDHPDARAAVTAPAILQSMSFWR